MAEHGSATRYRDGCRCQLCKKANTDRARRRRLASVPKSTVLQANVVAISSERKSRQPNSTTADTMGPNELAVIEVFNRLDPDGLYAVQCEQARAMSRILDDPEARGGHVQALRGQLEALKVLEPRKTKSRGRLHVISAMTANVRAQ